MFDESWVIFKTLAGSQLYGTSTPESDIDLRGVCIPPQDVLLDPFQNFEQYEAPNEDTVIYSLKKFFQLASDCNPNIVELLFAEGDVVQTQDTKWLFIQRWRSAFLSTRARFTFVGYAESQLKRIRTHRGWLVDPPNKPDRKDFGLDAMPLYGVEKLNSLLASPVEVIREDMRQYAIQEMKYREASSRWSDYENWQRTRNPKRFALEEKYQYDTKHGMHLYRLLTEGKELLETGVITLPRPDASFLLEIRKGYFTYDALMELVGDFKQQIDSVVSPLARKPDINHLREIYYTLL